MQQSEALITTRSEEETIYAGMVLGREIKSPLVIALHGDLGTGKTAFVRGAACGLEVGETVTSPSFVLLKIYAGRLPVYHFDFYRLDEAASLDDLGFDEYLPGEGVAFVEWAENLPDIVPPCRLEIMMERFFDRRGEGRRIRFKPRGDEGAGLLDRMLGGLSRHPDGTLKMPPRATLKDRGK